VTAVETMTPQQLEAAEATLRRGTWTITAGAVLFSVLTVTPLVERVTSQEWQWTAPILPIVVDTAVVIVVRLDSTVSRLGGSTGGWPAVLRWMTGLFTLLLNVGDSALAGDLVGVAVHAVAPLLLIVTAEAGLAYRRKIHVQLEQLERSRLEQEARSRQEDEARRERERAEREHEQARREQAEREAREHAAALEREAREFEAQQRREEREHAAALEQQRAEREERLRREQQERADRERREQAEREAAERAARERQQREQREARERAAAAAKALREQSAPRAVNSGEQRPALTAVSPEPVNKMAEADARTYVESFRPGEKTVRELADATGWSVGWVSARLREARAEESGPSVALVPAAAGGGQR
jgi:DNA segregation ATPase FtsK/SpoIIIE-like protein